MPELSQINPYPNKEDELKRLFELYISECQYTKRLSPQTIKGYREVFRTFQKIVPEAKALNHLNAQTVGEFFRRLTIRKRIVGKEVQIGIKISTTNTYYRKLMVFFRWLETNEYLIRGSITKKVARPPTPVYTDDRALTEEEVSKFIAAITIYRSKDSFAYKRDQTIISILLYSGLRRGELLGLRVQDINFETNMIFVNHVTSKSKYDRYIPMHRNLRSTLREYLLERKDRGITISTLIASAKRGTAFTEHGLKHWVKKYKKLSGVNFHLHRCRHTFTCSLAKAGADIRTIMRLLGHTSMRMTLRYLRSLTPEDSRVYIEKLPF